ncbi:MAG: glycosyltransferase family protein [bacterium]
MTARNANLAHLGREPVVVATVECRMTSSRLPGKVMMPSGGRPMLEHLVRRLQQVDGVDHVVLATTTNGADDCIEQLARRLGVGCFRGSEDDVLDRVLRAARSVRADVIVEITGDCPLVDPSIVDQVLQLYLINTCDYASNDVVPSFPLGMDVQVFSTDLLARADREGETPEDREHVSWFIVRQPDRFRLLMLPAALEVRWPDLRLTLDEMPDFRVLDALISALHEKDPYFSCECAVRYLRAHPEIVALNRDIVQRMPEST